MQKNTDYKYDVAFSFLQNDESIAFHINDLIQDRFSTFIYSNKQEELGGTDGEKTFNSVFYEEARIVVILYREGWGKTAWTRIEETAIKNRAFNKGWEFLILINLDTKSSLPTWIPSPYIWLDYERFKAEGAIAIIDQKIQNNGGESRLETIEDKAKRFNRLRNAAKVRSDFLKSGKGFAEADSEVESIFTMVKESKSEVENNNSPLKFSTNEGPTPFYEFGHNNYWLLFVWRRSYFELHERHLEVFIYEKIKRSHLGLSDKETTFEQAKYHYDRDLTQTNVWINGSKHTSKELVYLWLTKFIEYLSKREGNIS